MIVHVGGSSARNAAHALFRAAEATLKTAGDRDPVAAALEPVARPRFRSMKAATKTLSPKIAAAITSAREAFQKKAGIREADSSDQFNLADFLSAVDAMSPTQLELALAAAMNELYRNGLAHVATELNRTFKLVPKRAIAALDDYALTFSVEVLDDEKAALKTIIRDAFTRGVNVSSLATEITQFFDDGIHRTNKDGNVVAYDLDSWSTMVARTETARAQNQGALDAYQFAGAKNLIFVSAEDERVCPICDDLDGQVVAIGENFDGTDVDIPPIHPGCRCTVVAQRDENGLFT